MRRGSIWICALGLVSTAACATGYGPRGFKGGYSEVPLDANTFRVEFKGNGYTSRQRVETFLHYRCAEVALQAGYDWFVVLGGNTEGKLGSYTTPGQYTGQMSATGTTIGNTTWVQGTSSGTYTPGQTYNWTKYGATAVIKAFTGPKPADLPVMAFDAREVVQYLGPYVRKK